MAKENLISWEEIVNWNHNPHVTPTSSVSLKPKKPNLSNLTEYQKVQPFVIKLFKETREMLEKSAIKEESYCKEQFVTHLCLVSKNDGEERPGINEVSSKLIMYLNIFIPYKHFRWKGSICYRKLWEKATIYASLTLKKPMFVSHWKNSRRYIYISSRTAPYTNSFVCVLDLV